MSPPLGRALHHIACFFLQQQLLNTVYCAEIIGNGTKCLNIIPLKRDKCKPFEGKSLKFMKNFTDLVLSEKLCLFGLSQESCVIGSPLLENVVLFIFLSILPHFKKKINRKNIYHHQNRRQIHSAVKKQPKNQSAPQKASDGLKYVYCPFRRP